MDQIRQWLAGDRNYAAGVELYNAHGNSETLKKLFGHGEYSFSRKKLEATLEQLLVDPAQTVIKSAPSVPKVAKSDQSQALHDKMRPLLDERTMLHGQLTMYQELQLSQEQLKEIAFRIKALSRQIDPLYRHLQAGTTPEQEAEEDYESMDRALLPRKLANLKSNRTKIKKNPNRQDELPAIEAKIQKLTELIDKK